MNLLKITYLGKLLAGEYKNLPRKKWMGVPVRRHVNILLGLLYCTV